MDFSEELKRIAGLRESLKQRLAIKEKLLPEMERLSNNISRDIEIFSNASEENVVCMLSDLKENRQQLAAQFTELFPDRKGRQALSHNDLKTLLDERERELRKKIYRKKYTDCLEIIETIRFNSKDAERKFSEATTSLRKLDISQLSDDECKTRLGPFVDYFKALEAKDPVEQTKWVLALGGKLGPELTSVIITKAYTIQSSTDTRNHTDNIPDMGNTGQTGSESTTEAQEKSTQLSRTTADNQYDENAYSQLLDEFSSRTAGFSFLETLERIRCARFVLDTLDIVDKLAQDIQNNQRVKEEIQKKIESCKQPYLRMHGDNLRAYNDYISEINWIATLMDILHKVKTGREAIAQLNEKISRQLLMLYNALAHYYGKTKEAERRRKESLINSYFNSSFMQSYKRQSQQTGYLADRDENLILQKFKSIKSLKEGEEFVKELDAKQEIVKIRDMIDYNAWTHFDSITDSNIRDFLRPHK